MFDDMFVEQTCLFSHVNGGVYIQFLVAKVENRRDGSSLPLNSPSAFRILLFFRAICYVEKLPRGKGLLISGRYKTGMRAAFIVQSISTD